MNRLAPLVLAALGACSAFSASVAGEPVKLSGMLWTSVRNAHVTTSGTLADTHPIMLNVMSYALSTENYGKIFGYGYVLSSLHDDKHFQHRAAFNEAGTGNFYGYDWRLSKDIVLCNYAGGIYNPHFGYRNGYRSTFWEYVCGQSLENPFLTPYWNMLGMISPNVWERVRFGVKRTFALSGSVSVTPYAESVWDSEERYSSRYGEKTNHPLFGGAIDTAQTGVQIDWRFAENWKAWVICGCFFTVDRQARRCEQRKTTYWSQTDWPILSVNVGRCF